MNIVVNGCKWWMYLVLDVLFSGADMKFGELNPVLHVVFLFRQGELLHPR